MLVLVITTDDKLVNKVKAAGHNPMKCTAADRAPGMLASGEFDAVVLGPPFTEINAKTLKHKKIFKVSGSGKLPDYFIGKQANLFEDIEKSSKPNRKIRASNNNDEIDPSDLGKVLLVTTNIELAKYLSDLDLKIVTNAFSAEKVMNRELKVIIWDVPEEPPQTSGILTYRWGEDLRHLEDIIEVLNHTDLSL